MDGERIPTPRAQRASGSAGGTVGLHQASCPPAGIVYGGDLMIKSGGPNFAASCHLLSSGHCFGGGMSFGSPFGAPVSTHRRIVAICSSVSDRSFLNF